MLFSTDRHLAGSVFLLATEHRMLAVRAEEVPHSLPCGNEFIPADSTTGLYNRVDAQHQRANFGCSGFSGTFCHSVTEGGTQSSKDAS